MLLLGAVMWALFGALPAGASAAAPGPEVIVVSTPGLTWDAVDPGAMPRLSAWLEGAAVATMNTRVAPEQSVADAYLSLGTGQRADGDGTTIRRVAGGAEIADFDALVERNAGSDFGAEPGAWGGSIGIRLVAAGGSSGEAAVLAAADREGHADAVFDPEDAVALDSAGRPVLLVDLAAGPGDRPTLDAAALDDALGRVLDAAPSDTLVIVANPVGGDGSPFGVFAMAGPGVRAGYATSSTTRRDGFVSLVDIAPSTLRRLGVAVPTSMVDAEITSLPDRESAVARVEQLRTLERRALDRDRTWIAHTAVLVVLVVVAGFAGLGVAAGRHRLRPAAAVLGLATMALPTVDLLGRGLGGWRLADPLQVALVPAVALGLAAALRPWRRRCGGDLVAGVAAAYLLVVAGDLLVDLGFQNDGTWGNSSVLAATSRFVGLGNLAFALAIAMCVIVLARLAERPSRGGAAPEHSRDPLQVTVPMVAIVVAFVVLDGAPGWGADVGGVLAGLPPLVLMLWVLSGRRISVRSVLAAGVAGVAVLGVFALVDAQRPVEERTHLTRFVTGLVNGDGARTFSRKFESNLDIVVASWWWVAIAIAAMWIAYATSPGTREALARLAGRHPVLVRLRLPALLLTVMTIALNDSGFAPSALQAVLLVALLATLVAVEERRPVALEPSGVRPPETVRDGAAGGDRGGVRRRSARLPGRGRASHR